MSVSTVCEDTRSFITRLEHMRRSRSFETFSQDAHCRGFRFLNASLTSGRSCLEPVTDARTVENVAGAARSRALELSCSQVLSIRSRSCGSSDGTKSPAVTWKIGRAVSDTASVLLRSLGSTLNLCARVEYVARTLPWHRVTECRVVKRTYQLGSFPHPHALWR
jgi:hypothetical protein